MKMRFRRLPALLLAFVLLLGLIGCGETNSSATGEAEENPALTQELGQAYATRAKDAAAKIAAAAHRAHAEYQPRLQQAVIREQTVNRVKEAAVPTYDQQGLRPLLQNGPANLRWG